MKLASLVIFMVKLWSLFMFLCLVFRSEVLLIFTVKVICVFKFCFSFYFSYFVALWSNFVFNCIECLDLGHIMLFHAFSWLFACDFHCFSTFSGPGKPKNYVFCLKASFGVCPATNSCRRRPTPLEGVALEPERLSSSGVGSKRHFPKWRWCNLSGVGPVLSEYGPAQHDPVAVTWKIATR